MTPRNYRAPVPAGRPTELRPNFSAFAFYRGNFDLPVSETPASPARTSGRAP